MQIFQRDTPGKAAGLKCNCMLWIIKKGVLHYCTINQIYTQLIIYFWAEFCNTQLIIYFSLQRTPDDLQQCSLSGTLTWMPLPYLLRCWERFAFLKISAWWIFIHAPGQILLSVDEALNHYLLQVIDYSIWLIQTEFWSCFLFSVLYIDYRCLSFICYCQWSGQKWTGGKLSAAEFL